MHLLPVINFNYASLAIYLRIKQKFKKSHTFVKEIENYWKRCSLNSYSLFVKIWKGTPCFGNTSWYAPQISQQDFPTKISYHFIKCQKGILWSPHFDRWIWVEIFLSFSYLNYSPPRRLCLFVTITCTGDTAALWQYLVSYDRHIF